MKNIIDQKTIRNLLEIVNERMQKIRGNKNFIEKFTNLL